MPHSTPETRINDQQLCWQIDTAKNFQNNYLKKKSKTTTKSSKREFTGTQNEKKHNSFFSNCEKVLNSKQPISKKRTEKKGNKEQNKSNKMQNDIKSQNDKYNENVKCKIKENTKSMEKQHECK